MRRALFCVFVLLCTIGAQAHERPQSCVARPTGEPKEVGDFVFATHLIGRVVEHAGKEELQLAVRTGEMAIHGLRIYSEPTHILLAAAIDRNYAKSKKGQGWRSTFDPSGTLTVVETNLLSADFLVFTAPAPSSDSRISVYLNATFPGGADEDRLIADGTVNVSNFAFSTSVNGSQADPQQCCETSCGQRCDDCPSARFTCCVPGCWMACGFIRDSCP